MGGRPPLASFFRSEDSARDKYLARLFGLFSEHLVRDWCADIRGPYEDLGRPTLWSEGDIRGATLDFTLRDRVSLKTYVAEMKVELEFEGHRYMTLDRVEQLAHHRLPAFQRFLEVARDPSAHVVRVNGKPESVDGAILIWGAVSEAGKKPVMETTGLHDVLSLESIVANLRDWRPSNYIDLIDRLRQAGDELFEWLT